MRATASMGSPAAKPASWPPGGFTGWLVRCVVAPDAPPTRPDVRLRLGMLQSWVGILANLVIFLFKGFLGVLLGSIALVADAFDSLSDVGASVLILVGCRWAQKPKDAQHPFGHGRAELVTSLILAVLLIVVGLALAKECIMRLLHPRAYLASWWVIGAVALTIPVKEWLAMFSRRLSQASGSSLMEAGYWHLRFDAIMAALVCFALWSSRMGWGFVDGCVGVVIAGLIVRAGVELVRERISPLLGEAPSAEELGLIEQAARGQAGVRGVHDIIVHKYGDLHLVSLHIEVDAQQPVMDLHELSERVEREVERATGAKAVVHVDPVDRGHPFYARAEKLMQDWLAGQRVVREFHDLRVTGKGERLAVGVDVVMGPEVPEAEQAEVVAGLRKLLESELGAGGRVSVVAEVSFEGDASGPAV